MLEILAITGPIFLCIALGFASTRAGLFSRGDMRTFGKFVINLALPALLFNALASRRLADLNHADYLLAYGISSVWVALTGIWWYRRVQQQGLTASSVAAMGMACPNSGYVGYPIMMLTFPDIAGVILALNIVVENMVTIPLVLALAERGQGKAKQWQLVVQEIFMRLITNPLVIAVLAGMLFSALQWTLPGPVARTINLFASASTALALFVIGGSLVGLSLHGLGPRVLPIAVGKLVLHPLAGLLVLLAMSWGGFGAMEPTLQKALILSLAMPMMGIYPVLAMQFKQEDQAAAALLVTTVMSFFTINVVMWGLHAVNLGP